MPNRLPRLLASALLLSTLGISQPNLTDADLFGAVARENDPARKLALLDQWTARYPQSAFRQQRNLQYIAGYSTLARVATAPGAPATATTAAEDAAHAMLARSDAFFAPDLMPAGVKPFDWDAARLEFMAQAHSALATFALNAKHYPEAEAELAALLGINRDNAVASWELGRAVVAEQNTSRYPAAIFHLARAVSVTGPGALPDETEKSAEAYLETIYRNYHGSLSGLDQVKRASLSSPAPPSDWTIQSIAAISQQQLDQDTAFARDHPEVVLWRNLKARLTAADGEEYFASEVKGTEMPAIKGKVSGQIDSKTLVLVMDEFADEPSADATLKLDTALKSRVEPGTTLEFSGEPQSFVKVPFAVTIGARTRDVKGLPR